MHQTTVGGWFDAVKKGRRLIPRKGADKLREFFEQHGSEQALRADRVRRLIRDVVDGDGVEPLGSELSLRERFAIAQRYALLGYEGEPPLSPEETERLTRIQIRRLRTEERAPHDPKQNRKTRSDPD